MSVNVECERFVPRVAAHDFAGAVDRGDAAVHVGREDHVVRVLEDLAVPIFARLEGGARGVEAAVGHLERRQAFEQQAPGAIEALAPSIDRIVLERAVHQAAVEATTSSTPRPWLSMCRPKSCAVCSAASSIVVRPVCEQDRDRRSSGPSASSGIDAPRGHKRFRHLVTETVVPSSALEET